jgi:hypothetical protein
MLADSYLGGDKRRRAYMSSALSDIAPVEDKGTSSHAIVVFDKPRCRQASRCVSIAQIQHRNDRYVTQAARQFGKRFISSKVSRTIFSRFWLRAHAAQANQSYLKATHPDEPAPPDVAQALERHAQVSLTTYSRPPLIFTRGKGCKIYDTQDREYLDLSGGIAVNALGHADEQVARILFEQASHFSGHLSSMLILCTGATSNTLLESVPQRMVRRAGTNSVRWNKAIRRFGL